MRVREQLNRRLQPLMIGVYGGFAMVLASAVVGSLIKGSSFSDYLLIPMGLGIAATVASMFVIQFGVRCPVCRFRLGHLLFGTGHVWRFGKHFNFCPKCGTPFDQEVSS